MEILQTCWSEMTFDARRRLIRALKQVNFHDAIVVDSQCLTERILCDFEPPVQIAPQEGREVKRHRQR